MLFSIEVTSTYFPVRNYFYSFYAAVVGSIVNRSITGSPFVLSTELPRESWVWVELVFHALVGKQTALLVGLHKVAYEDLQVSWVESWVLFLYGYSAT